MKGNTNLDMQITVQRKEKYFRDREQKHNFIRYRNLSLDHLDITLLKLGSVTVILLDYGKRFSDLAQDLSTHSILAATYSCTQIARIAQVNGQ